jgi:hypothetical protein
MQYAGIGLFSLDEELVVFASPSNPPEPASLVSETFLQPFIRQPLCG